MVAVIIVEKREKSKQEQVRDNGKRFFCVKNADKTKHYNPAILPLNWSGVVDRALTL